MSLELHSFDAPHLVSVMQTPDYSLSFLMEDLNASRTQPAIAGKSDLDLEAWINALHRQAIPLVASSTGRANLEEWLALVESETTSSED